MNKKKAQNQLILRLLPAMGLEPIRCCHQQILSLPRLPFRHAGKANTHNGVNLIIV